MDTLEGIEVASHRTKVRLCSRYTSRLAYVLGFALGLIGKLGHHVLTYLGNPSLRNETCKLDTAFSARPESCTQGAMGYPNCSMTWKIWWTPTGTINVSVSLINKDVEKLRFEKKLRTSGRH
jgi:hypothetical protein